jgi:hypothetical protein
MRPRARRTLADIMIALHRFHTSLVSLISLAAAVGTLAPSIAAPQSMPTPASASVPAASVPHDGQHDFDWMVGTWKATLKKLEKPLTGSTTWVEFEGTQTTRLIWGGRGVMDEFSVRDPKTNAPVEGLTIRLYNPKSQQWSIYWANANNGSFSLPATMGRYTSGRGEFYDHEEYQGKMIFVRYVWSDITQNSAHFEQSFSEDGGKTWEPNWISTITRVKE